LWASAEELLIDYNEKPFVSDMYRASLDGVTGRAERMADVDLPAEMPEWMDSLGQDNIRSLSVTLLIDLLTLEQDETRASDIAKDMDALAEDLLMSGAYEETRTVTQALADRAGTAEAIGREGCRQALEALGESIAMRETAPILGDIDEAAWENMRAVITMTGPPSINALTPVMASEEPTLLVRRAADLIVGFGAAAVPRIAPMVEDDRWFVQRNAAQMLGRIAAPEGVPLLQSMLRRGEPRSARATVSALIGIHDPSAGRAIHTVLRSATGELRRAVIEALVADRDPRVVPMLGRIIAESQPLGKDHVVVLETLAAIGTVGSETGVPTLARAIRRRAFFRRKRLRAIKKSGVDALARIGGPLATDALDEAVKTGDRMLRKIVTAQRI
jgi:HEAT repeat protein